MMTMMMNVFDQGVQREQSLERALQMVMVMMVLMMMIMMMMVSMLMLADRVSCNYEQCQTTRERHHSKFGSLTVLNSVERSIHTIPYVVLLVAWASSSGSMRWC